MVEESRSRLGRGLAALIGESGDAADAVAHARGQRTTPIEFLRPNPHNPRKHFSDEQIQELADSIRQKGIIQPILVRAFAGVTDAFEIIAGERRWRAAQRAGLHDVPIRVVEATDQEALEFAIVENVQRSDLNAIEEAQGYDRLATEFAYSQSDIARITGKSRSHVANTVRLLKLSDEIKKHVVAGNLSAGHARALLTAPNPDALARRVIEQGLTVRDIEHIAQNEHVGGSIRKNRAESAKDADTRALETALSEILGLVVSIHHSGEKGEVRVRYRTLDQLDALCQKLKQ